MSEYKPDPKIVAAAVATLLVWGLQAVLATQVPPGIEGAIAVIVAYLVPSTSKRPLDGPPPPPLMHAPEVPEP